MRVTALLPALAAAGLLRAANSTEPPCALPADLRNHTAQGWSLLLQASTRHGVVVLGQGDEDAASVNLLLYDCAKGKRLLFLHIPKNAGSTIEDVAAKAGVQWGRHNGMAQRLRMPDGNECNAWHAPPAYLPPPNPYENAEVFCVTRHPYDRLLSEYRYLLNVPWGGGNPRLRAAKECTPEGLNTFLQQTLRVVQQGQRFVSDCHFVPQAEYVWGPHRQWCTNILRIDTLPGSFNSLMRAKGLGVMLGSEKKNSKADSCEGLSTASFTPETRRLIGEVYAADFSRLGYTVPA